MTAEKIYQEIGQRIRNERCALGFSQTDLAECIGYGPQHAPISQIELGKQRPEIHVLIAIAEALGVEIADLLPESTRGNRRFTICESARALEITETTILHYIQHSHVLPERYESGNLYLIQADLDTYREQHQKDDYRRGKAKNRQPESQVPA
jgi:transcriptional regulator with XRE-family HTH domain